jgi:hypothetical protein
VGTSVSDVLLDPANRPRAVTTLTRVIHEEVAGKRGVSGRAVWAAYTAVRVMGRHLVADATDQMLPDFTHALDGLWATKGDADFASHLVAHADEAADALLAVTDAQARHSHHAALAVVYGRLRGHALEHVTAALPRLGRAISSLMDDPHGPLAPGEALD